eukprot:TRINITY_DN1372_c0_g1_i2.p1 TRINITY_DN1372_c0_g1~~TRINITY_DN1372_c0_g1_i2.p1  ORF type:complete len:358 (+),score=140.85 TRINITY_DN1372_c0_g1_i2:37-1074(+)
MFDQVHRLSGSIADKHDALSKSLRKELVNPMNKTANTFQTTLENNHNDAKRQQKDMVEGKKAYRKVQQKYMKLSYEKHKLETGANADKHSDRIKSLTVDVEQAEEEYRAAFSKLTESQKPLYDDAVTQTLTRFQGVVEQRDNFLEDRMSQLGIQVERLYGEGLAKCQEMGDIVKNVPNHQDDLDQFVKKQSTGDERGLTIEFRPFTLEAYYSTVGVNKSHNKVKIDMRQRQDSLSSDGYDDGDDKKEGYLMKQGHLIKNWKRRFFVLSDKTLFYYKEAGDQSPIAGIPLEGTSIEVAEGKIKKKYCFELNYTAKKYYLAAGNKEEMLNWISAIRTAQGREGRWNQ